MPILGSGSEAQFLFKIADNEFGVVEFSAQEEFSSPFNAYLIIASEDEVNFDDVIGKQALLTMLGDEQNRYIHGIVSEFVYDGSKGRFFLYKARVVPSIWLLTFEQDCRIFQNKNVPDIVKEILEDRQITSDTYEFRLKETYQPRDYCVQYRETDLNFISRLLEEEGIFYYFEHTDQQHTLVFGDSTVNYKPIEGDANVVYNASEDMIPEEESVYSFSLTRQIQTGKITLRDYNFERPSLDLTAGKEAESFKTLERYDFPGEYYDQDRGKDLSEVRLQESVMFADYGEGQSVCQRLMPVFTFELTDHEVESSNQEYLLTEVNHSGSQPQTLEEEASGGDSSYSNQFVAVPAAVAIRPPRKTPKPIMEGVQTAMVVGPTGEEIYTDEHGRVKVQFHWDREGEKNENSSCWIRVSQISAGAGWGGMDVPRIGHEVIVDFVEGDPDRPIITGRVYNGSNTPPFDPGAGGMVSGMKSNSTPGGGGYNEISLNDTKGKEGMVIHAQKDQTTTIQNNRTTTLVGGSDSLTVQAGSRTVSVDGGDSSTTASAAVKITGKGAGVEITGNGGPGVKAAGTPNFEATGAAKAMISSPDVDIGHGVINIHGSGVVNIKGSTIKLTAGGSSIEMGPSGIKITAGAPVEIKGAIVKVNC